MHLAKLKKLRFIRVESFDGRKRVLRVCKKTTHENFDTSRVKDLTPPPRKKLHPSPMGSSIEPESKGYNKEKEEEERAKPKEPAPTELESKNAETKLASRRKRLSEPVHDEEAWKKAHIARERKKVAVKESKAEKAQQSYENMSRAEKIYRDWLKNPGSWEVSRMVAVEGILYGRLLIDGELKMVRLPDTDEELATWKK